MEWLEEIQEGLPNLLFVPARKYKFKVSKERYVISFPRKGAYKELNDKFFDEESGEFNILDENNVLFTPALTKVMLARGNYPELKDTEAFVPIAIVFEEEEVKIFGNVIEMLNEKGE